jgi:uncharacterized protein
MALLLRMRAEDRTTIALERAGLCRFGQEAFKMKQRWIIAGILLAAAGAGGGYWVGRGVQAGGGANPEVSAMRFAPYAAQRVVYHVTGDGGFRGRGYRNLMHIAGNHMASLGEGRLDLRMVVQGEGLNLLRSAKSDPELAAKIDALKARGARFLVCRNTLTVQGVDPYAQLYGVTGADIVPAGVAEVSDLVQKGYANIRF